MSLYRNSRSSSVRSNGHSSNTPRGGYQANPAPQGNNSGYYNQQSAPVSNQQYGGGFNRGAMPPPGVDPKLWSWFQSVDEDRSGAITADELQRALVNGNWTPFDIDTVRMLMGLFDTDRSGTIGFDEFVGLWKYIADWQGVFKYFDKDQSGSIDGTELAAALRKFGYELSPQLLSLVEQKYAASLTAGYGTAGGISFDRFVRCCVTIKTLTESFQQYDTGRTGWIRIDYESFMKLVLSAP